MPRERRRSLDVAIGVVVVVLAAGYLAQARNISTTLSEDVLGPRAFPQLLAGLAAVLGTAILLRALLTGNNSRLHDRQEPADATPWRAYATMGIYGAYIWALVPLGYVLSTTLFALALLVVLGLRPLFRAPLIALALTAVLYVAFGRLLNVDLPTGPLPAG